MEDIKIIRAAVCRNHGGMEQATDSQILTVWQSLTAETQKKYLSQKEEKDAVSSRP
jgi:hypothetical protein